MNKHLENLRNSLEGPVIIRICGLLAAVGMLVATVLNTYKIASEMRHPNQLILKIYEGIFSILVIVMELKSAGTSSEKLNKVQNFYFKWMPFLSVMGGKGAFYLFTGSLSVAFYTNLILVVPGLLLAAIGLLYVLMHFGRCRNLAEMYNELEKADVEGRGGHYAGLSK